LALSLDAPVGLGDEISAVQRFTDNWIVAHR
jgi:hypothetical protein